MGDLCFVDIIIVLYFGVYAYMMYEVFRCRTLGI